MLNTIFTIALVIVKQVLPLIITNPKFGKLFALAYDAVAFVQENSTGDSEAKRAEALDKLKTSAYSAGITASDHLLNKSLEWAVGELKSKTKAVK